MYGTIIRRTWDGSYVIENGTRHIPNPDGDSTLTDKQRDYYRPEYEEVHTYAQAHPECGTEEEPYVPPIPTLQEAKAAKLTEINAAADRAIATLTATYPDREIATFDKQEAEARAYTADPTAPTPLLSALSKARGVPLDELARRVLVKADAFAVASGSIIGQRQALEDRLDACTTVEEVEALAVTITMPGGEAGA